MTTCLRLLLVLLVAVCGAAACSRASAEPEHGLPMVDVEDLSPGVPAPIPDTSGGSDLEQLAGLENAPLNMEVYEVIAQLQGLADASGDGIPALGRDPERITLYWFGPLPQAVENVIADNAGVIRVEVVPTPYRYGDLVDEARRLIQAYAPAVAAVGPRPQADGIDITIATAAVENAGNLDTVLAGIDTPYPLFAETGDIVPISAG
jgi:hypothetical protein